MKWWRWLVTVWVLMSFGLFCFVALVYCCGGSPSPGKTLLEWLRDWLGK